MQKQQPTMQVAVWRGDVSGGAFEDFEVPRYQSQTILDVVTWIQRHGDASLSYRFACRVGMCGSCAMMVNGIPRWTCRTHVDKALAGGNELRIEPLRNLPVIKDLATDMTQFFDKWTQAEARHYPTASRADPMPLIDPADKQRVAASDGIECINCAVCYAACDVVESNPDYLGPAALNRAWTLINDQRDGGRKVRLKAISSDGGCHNCHSHQSCMQHCPNELNPTLSIAGLKRATAMAALKGEL